MTMLDKIARAMCNAAWAKDDEDWSLAGDEQQAEFRLMARAALEAMREPNDVMLEAGRAPLVRILNGPDATYQAMISGPNAAWQAMIATALNEETQG